MLEDTQAPVLLTQSALPERLPAQRAARWSAWMPTGTSIVGEPDGQPAEGERRQPGLCDLHVGLHGTAQGCDDRASHAAALLAWVASAIITELLLDRVLASTSLCLSIPRSGNLFVTSSAGLAVVLAASSWHCCLEPPPYSPDHADQTVPSALQPSRWRNDSQFPRSDEYGHVPASTCCRAWRASHPPRLPNAQLIQPLWPDRDTRRTPPVASEDFGQLLPDRPPGRRTRRCTWWIDTADRCRWGCRGSCTSAGAGLRGAI